MGYPSLSRVLFYSKNDTNLFWIMNICPPHNEGNEDTDTVDDTR